MKNFIVLLAAAAVFPLTAAQAGPKDEKDIIQTVPPPQEGGFYLSLFGGANVYQSSDSKDINVTGATPLKAGTPAQISSYYLPGSNSSVPQAFPPNGLPPNDFLTNGTKVHSPTFSTNTQSNTGWFGGLKLGYEFPTHSIIKPELEFEAFYFGNDTGGTLNSKNKITGLRTTDNDGDEASEPFLNPDAVVPPTKAYVNFVDQMNAAVFMVNGLIKFDLGRFRPYIGAGVGLAYVTHSFGSQTGSGSPVTPNAQLIQTKFGAVEHLALNNSPSAENSAPAGYFAFGSNSEETFAWQALAGVEFAVTPRVSVFTEYKALWFLDGPYYRDYLSQMVGAGVRFSF